MYKRLTLCFVCLIAFISISLGSGECVRVEPVTFGSEKCEAVEMTAAPFDHTEPFDYEYDDGLGGLSLSSPVADLCEALRIQAEHACSVTSVEFYVVRGGSLEIHIWDVDTLRFPASHELITPFIEEIDSSGYGGWEEIMLPSPIYLPPLGECVVGRKIIEPFRPVVYLSRMEDIEERSFLYIPSSHQWLRPNYADTTRSWNVTYLIRAHGWYYYVPDEYIFELDTSIVTSTNRGVALCDCDGDLDADLATGSQLYRNDSGTYNLVTGTGISGIGYPFWGDFDLNGKPDIFFCADSTLDKLYANGGSGSFYHDVTTPAGGMSNPYNTEAAAWLDYDKDGDLDIYVANSSTFDPADSSWTYYHDLFYRNEGAYFTEYTDAAGIGYAVSSATEGKAIALGDWNCDGWTDIYVSNGNNFPNYLWKNRGDGMFDEVAYLYGVDGVNEGGGIYGHSMGACFGDIDNDGDPDLFVASEAYAFGYSTADRSMLYVNQGTPYFYMIDERAIRGIEDHTSLSVPLFIDYDNDGWLDIFVTSMKPGCYSIMYHNDGDGTFTNVTEESGLSINGASSASFADIDLDGYIDLIVESGNSKLIYKNNMDYFSGTSNNWVRFYCEGNDGNKLGIGTRIDLFAGGIHQMREIGSQYGGLHSQSEPVAHFGIGSEIAVDSVIVHWNSGTVERVYDVLPNFNYNYLEGEHVVGEIPAKPADIAIFSYPNPFNSAVSISVVGVGATDGRSEQVGIEIFDIAGRLVADLPVTNNAGALFVPTPVVWQPDESIGSGVYLIRVRQGDNSIERKVMFIK